MEVEDLATKILGHLSTHSLRKIAVDMTRGNGCLEDKVDVYGRWKSNKRQQNT